MAKEFIVGRKGNQPFEIGTDCTAVSGNHAKITISDNGQWTLEDTNSANGVFIKDENGNFNQVYSKRISEDTIIRLGPEGHMSYTFMAHRLLAPQDDYSYEFQWLRRKLTEQEELEEKMEKKQTRNAWISRLSSIAVGVPFVIAGAIFKEAKWLLDFRFYLIMFLPTIVGLFFTNDPKKTKEVRQRRQHLMVCPKCGRPLTPFEISSYKCSVCRAH